MLDGGARYFQAHASLKPWLAKMREHSRNYLAHEYFNRDWHPMPFSEVAQALSEAKLDFAASANLSDHLDGLGASEPARKLLAEVRHPVLRETVRDYLSNQRFRRDIFVKGLRRLPVVQREQRLRDRAFVLLTDPGLVPMTLPLPSGQAQLHPEIYQPLIAALAQDAFAPKTLGALERHPECAKLNFGQIVQAVLLLTGANHVHPAQAQGAAAMAAPRCRALNSHILEKAVLSEDVMALASPVTGGGVIVHRLHQLFLRAFSRGLRTDAELAAHAWECFSANGQRLINAGKTLQTPQENLDFLRDEAKTFSAKRLPIFRALSIA